MTQFQLSVIPEVVGGHASPLQVDEILQFRAQEN